MAHECTSTNNRLSMLGKHFLAGVADGAKTALIIVVWLIVLANVGSYFFTTWLIQQKDQATVAVVAKTDEVDKLLIPMPYMDVEHTEAYQNQIKSGVNPLVVIAAINAANSNTVPEMLKDGSFAVFVKYVEQVGYLKSAEARSKSLDDLTTSVSNSIVLYPGYWLAN